MKGHITPVCESERVCWSWSLDKERAPFTGRVHRRGEEREKAKRDHYMDATNIHPLIRVNYYVSFLLIATETRPREGRKKERKKKSFLRETACVFACLTYQGSLTLFPWAGVLLLHVKADGFTWSGEWKHPSRLDKVPGVWKYKEKSSVFALEIECEK